MKSEIKIPHNVLRSYDNYLLYLALVCDEYTEIWSSLKGVFIQGEASVISKGSKFHKLRKLLYQKYPKYEREAPIEEGKTVIIEVISQNVVSWGP